jgi:hypothetical protein
MSFASYFDRGLILGVKLNLSSSSPFYEALLEALLSSGLLEPDLILFSHSFT